MRLSIAALTLTVLLAAAPAAQAADVSLSDTGELRVTDADGVANDIRVWRNAGIAVADNAAPLNLAAGSCTVVSIHFVSCPEAAVTRIVVHAGGGDDTITPSGSLGGRTTELYGDEGDDKLVAAGDGATFDGGAGDDTFTESLPGIGATADDTVVGGPGFDTITYAERNFDPVQVTLGGAVATTGNGDRWESDTISGVEGVVGSDLADHLTGDDGDNYLNGLGGDDVLEGGGGADYLVGAGGADTIRGGAGDDHVFADEGVFGLATADVVDCGDGNDWLRRDLRLDPAPADCEGALAQFTGPAVISGRSVVGSTLTVTAPVDGTPEPTVDTVWWSCFDVCEEVGTGPRYTTTADDVDHDISAQLVAVNDATDVDPGTPDVADSDNTVHVTAAADGTVVPEPATLPPPRPRPQVPARPHLPSVSRPSLVAHPTPAPALLPGFSYASAASKALGAEAVLAPGGSRGGLSAYVRRGRRGVLRVGARPVPAIAVFSSPAATVSARQVLELTPRRGHLRRMHLATTSLGASATTPQLVVVRLSATQRRLVRSARAARLVVTLGGAPGVVVSFRLPTR